LRLTYGVQHADRTRAQQQLRKLVRQVQEDAWREADQRRASRESADQNGAVRVKLAHE